MGHEGCSAIPTASPSSWPDLQQQPPHHSQALYLGVKPRVFGDIGAVDAAAGGRDMARDALSSPDVGLRGGAHGLQLGALYQENAAAVRTRQAASVLHHSLRTCERGGRVQWRPGHSRARSTRPPAVTAVPDRPDHRRSRIAIHKINNRQPASNRQSHTRTHKHNREEQEKQKRESTEQRASDSGRIEKTECEFGRIRRRNSHSRIRITLGASRKVKRIRRIRSEFGLRIRSRQCGLRP